jgi:hypothetical protein
MTAWRTIVGFIAGALSGLPAVAGFQEAVLAHFELADVGETVVVRGMAGPDRGAGAEEYFVFFQFEGVLWCYAPGTGTRVFGPAPTIWPPSDKQVLKWIKETDASFHQVSVYCNLPAPASLQAELPHACVVACLAQISNLLLHAGPPDEVGLVLLSYDRERSPGGGVGPLVIGHSLLVYRYQGQWFCFDPRGRDAPRTVAQVAVGAPLDPTLKALAERPDCRLAHARLLRISRRTLDQLDASLTWRLLTQHPE